MFVSLPSIAELRRGIALMDAGRRRTALAVWLANDLPARFVERILSIEAIRIIVLKCPSA